MEAFVIEQWELNKDKLRKWFAETRQEEYDSYDKIVRKIFTDIVPEISKHNYKEKLDVDNMTIIDDGHYQGTQIFIIPSERYQPSETDYYITHNGYGSCSGCDTLQSIHEYEDGLPTEEQVNEYMTLALHIVQKTKKLY